jgi:hypothetical protein
VTSLIYFRLQNDILELRPAGNSFYRFQLNALSEKVFRNSQAGLKSIVSLLSASHPGLKMSQQFIDQTAHSSQNWFFGMYSALKKWIAKEIIDFDPFDDEVIVASEVLEQFLNIKNDQPCIIAPTAVNNSAY